MFNIYRMLCVALKKSLTGQIQYSSDFHDPIKKHHPVKFPIPRSVMLFEKPWLSLVWKRTGLYWGQNMNFLHYWLKLQRQVSTASATPTLKIAGGGLKGHSEYHFPAEVLGVKSPSPGQPTAKSLFH